MKIQVLLLQQPDSCTEIYETIRFDTSIYTILSIHLVTPLPVAFNRHKTETDYITYKISLHTS